MQDVLVKGKKRYVTLLRAMYFSQKVRIVRLFYLSICILPFQNEICCNFYTFYFVVFEKKVLNKADFFI